MRSAVEIRQNKVGGLQIVESSPTHRTLRTNGSDTGVLVKDRRPVEQRSDGHGVDLAVDLERISIWYQYTHVVSAQPFGLELPAEIVV